MPEIIIYNGDNRLILKEFPDASFDSCVCDPPYELGFMGKAWDKSGIAYDVAMWKEVYRVLKPGAHLLAFGGSRTYHRLACAIEDAGFIIRDQIMWLYGSGFPKNLDISKQMDKPGKIGIWNDEFDKVRAWLREKVKAKGLRHKEIDRAIGNENSHMASHFLGISQPMLPTWDQWVIIKKLLDIDEDLEIVPKCIGYEYAGYERAIIGYRKVHAGVAFSSEGPSELPITVPNTDLSRKWDGWGTALKPAHEPIVVARKPLEGTVVNNVLKHGTGAINVGVCGVEANGDNANARKDKSGGCQFFMGGDKRGPTEWKGDTNRWPANVIHDGSDEVLAEFALQSAIMGVHGAGHKREKIKYKTQHFGIGLGNSVERLTAGRIGDTGTAARFFYCAKASQEERNRGCEGLQKQSCGMMEDDNYPIKTGSGNLRNTTRRNIHPTVKPLVLMCYLVRLVTPPGGVVLDPFMGSGSTLIAAAKEGFDAVGIDLEMENCVIAERRCRGHLGMLAEVKHG